MRASNWFSKAPLWIKVQPEGPGVLVAVAGGTLVRVGVKVGMEVDEGVKEYVIVLVNVAGGVSDEVWLGVMGKEAVPLGASVTVAVGVGVLV